MSRLTSTEPPRAYEPRRRGFYALEPSALMELFIVPSAREIETRNGAAIVDVRGPLDQRAGGWCDSYEAVRARVQLACKSSARAVVLRLDSPGGDVAGCFDAVRGIRADCLAAQKPLIAYVEGKACSAGYALAAAAQEIVMSETAIVGSIGIISTREDMSAMNAARGLRVAFISSGARKADGHPDQPITEAELAESQRVIDSIAAVFFALVEDMRGVPAGAIKALDARVFHGEAAISARLADCTESFDAMLARIASGKVGSIMASDYEKARDALEKAAAGDDANAAAAKRALAAMGEGAGDEDSPAEEEVPPDEAEAAAAAAALAAGDKTTEPDALAAGDKTTEPAAADQSAQAGDKVAASASATALRALAEVHQLKAERAAEKTKAERDALIASRKDFSAEMRAALQTADIATVRTMVKTLKRGPVATPAAAATVTGTRGKTQGGSTVSADAAPPTIKSELDRRMGLTSQVAAVTHRGNTVFFGLTDQPVTPAATADKGGAK